MKKSQLLETINEFPEEFSVDELIDKLYVIEKIDKGRDQVKSGKINTEAETKKKLDKWLK